MCAFNEEKDREKKKEKEIERERKKERKTVNSNTRSASCQPPVVAPRIEMSRLNFRYSDVEDSLKPWFKLKRFGKESTTRWSVTVTSRLKKCESGKADELDTTSTIMDVARPLRNDFRSRHFLPPTTMRFLLSHWRFFDRNEKIIEGIP
ncbi:uncharacterized protein LOC124947110 [Vespa velutina]|uniref:uncharacterized protein LOC124947110 n=1 Tax=Vespa velutina TaxID=202808 RepID=UPI001FB3F1CE|nr:uncharacterized protein LOC124947110 [Vespa velutina]